MQALFESKVSSQSKLAEEFQYEDCGCKQILVVDDDVLNLDFLAGMISENIGISVETASNGIEAVQKFIDNRQKYCCSSYFKLILMDIRMPEMDGFEASE